MANVLVNDLYLGDIADAIRSKLNVQTTYKPSEMANAIDSISGGGGSSLGTKSITANGTYNASSDSLDGYSQVTVNVPQGVTPTGTKQISITENGTTTEDVTNYANAEITVNVSGSSGNPVYLTKVLTSSGDITIKQVMDTVQYQMHYTDAIVAIRANGSTAPPTGSYTLNNFWFVFENNVRKSGAHEYRSGKVTPDSIGFWISGREEDRTMSIENGVLTSSSTSTNCLGGTGTEIMILEIPFSYSTYMGL